MEIIMKFNKEEACYDIDSEIKEKVSEMINKNFEAVDGTLKSKIQVKVEITVLTDSEEGK